MKNCVYLVPRRLASSQQCHHYPIQVKNYRLYLLLFFHYPKKNIAGVVQVTSTAEDSSAPDCASVTPPARIRNENSKTFFIL